LLDLPGPPADPDRLDTVVSAEKAESRVLPETWALWACPDHQDRLESRGRVVIVEHRDRVDPAGIRENQDRKARKELRAKKETSV